MLQQFKQYVHCINNLAGIIVHRLALVPLPQKLHLTTRACMLQKLKQLYVHCVNNLSHSNVALLHA